MYPEDKLRRVGHFVADEMSIPHDGEDNYTFSSPGELEDFQYRWNAVMELLTL